MIPVAKPQMTNDDAKAVADAVLSGWILQGPKVEAFEQKLAGFTGSKYCIATSSCTTAMHLGFIASGIKPGDEILVPSFSYIASANSIVHAGGTPVFVDIDERTYNLDPSDVERKITKKTRGILAVHQIGLAADMPALAAIAKKYNLELFEDAACGLGATISEKHIGNYGSWSAYSFHPRKAITTAEGGILATDDIHLAEMVQQLRAHGASMDVSRRHTSKTILHESFPFIGYNFRMSDIHAALGLSQFERIEYLLAERKRIAQNYNEAFEGIDKIIRPFVPKDYSHTYQSYMIRITNGMRDHIMQQLLDHGIATRAGVMASHLEPPYRKLYPNLSLPVTEKVAKEALILPSYAGMTMDDQQTVIDRLKKSLAQV